MSSTEKEWLRAALQSSSAPPSARYQIPTTVFPTQEHHQLRASDTKTELRKAIWFKGYNPKKPTHNAGAEALETYDQLMALKRKYSTWNLPHRRTLKGPKRTLEVWWATLVADATEHVTEILLESGYASKADTLLFKGEVQKTDSLSSTDASQASRKIYRVVSSLIADHPLAPNPEIARAGTRGGPSVDTPQEEWDISQFCRAALGIGSAPRTESSISKLKSLTKEVTSSLLRFREILNHTVMYAMTKFCHKDTVAVFVKKQKTHQAENNLLADESEHTLFTALPLIKYLREECSVENQVLIDQVKADIKKLHRYSGEAASDWLDRYMAPLAELKELQGGNDLTDEEAKALWKETWGRNINTSEHSVITAYKHKLSDAKWESIKEYAEGVFDVPTMELYLLDIQQYLKIKLQETGNAGFEPDSLVRQYNIVHYRNSSLSPKDIDYTPPAKRKRVRDAAELNRTKRPIKKKQRPARGSSLLNQLKYDDKTGCHTPSCRQKGPRVYRTHTDEQCHAVDAHGKSRGSNRPSAAPGSGRGQGWNSSPSSSSHPYQPKGGRGRGKGKGKGKRGKGKTSGEAPSPTCKLCHGNHHATACPLRANRKGLAPQTAARLTNSPQFQQRIRSYFTSEQDLTTAHRVLHAYDLPQVCQRCLYVDCDGYCQPDESMLHSVRTVKRALREDPDLATSFREAVFDDSEQGDRAVMAPVNAESFLAHSLNEDSGEDEDYDLYRARTIEEGGPSIFTSDTGDGYEDASWDQEDASWLTEGGADGDPSADVEDGADLGSSHLTQDADMTEEDYEGNFMETEGTAQFFTLGSSSPSDSPHPNQVLLDNQFGLEIYSPVYSLFTNGSQESRRSLICECTAQVLMPNGMKTTQSIKIDNCNSRMLAGQPFVRDIKSCYEYGIPPVRMKTTSKMPTSWKRDAGLLHYYDRNDVLCVSLVYVDYDNPDLILMDMSTMLDADVDEHYHARTSRESGVEPLLRRTLEPYHYKNFCSGGDPWVLPKKKEPAPSKAQTFYTALKRKFRALRRRGSASTKSAAKKQQYLPEESDECQCQVRVADSLDVEAYHRFVDGVSELSLREMPSGILAPHPELAS